MATANELNLSDSTAGVQAPSRIPRTSIIAEAALRTPKSAWKYLLVLNDVILILVAFAAAYYIRYQLQWFRSVDPAYQVDIWTYAPFALALIIILPISFRFSGVYPYRKRAQRGGGDLQDRHGGHRRRRRADHRRPVLQPAAL